MIRIQPNVNIQLNYQNYNNNLQIESQMLSVKILFQGKNFNLGKEISCFEDIYHQIQTRFPNECPDGIQIRYEGQVMASFDEIKNRAFKNNLSVIKLSVVPLKKKPELGSIFKLFDNSNVNKSQINKEQEASSSIFSVSRAKKTQKQREEIEKQDDYFNCFCQGKKVFCSLCNGHGIISNQSSFGSYINKIVETKLRKIQNKSDGKMEAQKMENLQSSFQSGPISKPMPLDIKLSNFNFYIRDDSFNRRTIEVNSKFQWTFYIEISSSRNEIYEVNIIDVESQRIMPFTVRNGLHKLKVGPYSAKYEGILGKKFRFFYFSEKSEIQYFGPEFWFNVEVINPYKHTSVHSGLRQAINAILNSKFISKDPEYVVKKLNEMGINEGNYLPFINTMGDIIEGLE